MTRAHACDRCKRRKVRCNGADPCSQCSRGNSPCERRTILRRPGPRVVKRPPNDADDAEDRRHAAASLGYMDDGQGEQCMAHGDGDGDGDSLPSVTVTDLGSEEAVVVAVHRPATGSPGVVAPDNLVWGEFLRVRAQLGARFHASDARSVSIEDVAHGCVDLFTQFLFPNTPIAHEPTLRASIPLLSADTAPSPAASTNDGPAAVNANATANVNEPRPMSAVRRFTLITALCAHIISVVPESLSRRPKALSVVFFDASRTMLRAYEAYDLEHPDATSLTIRMWHSSCAQNTTGKVGASWHYHTEASCLAQRLRLYDEGSVAIARSSALESRLLRANFWHLYLAEKTHVAFRTRPPIIDERICYGGITLRAQGDDGDGDEVDAMPLLDPRRRENQAGLERRIFVGFHLRRRISAMAAALIDDVASCSRRRIEAAEAATEAAKARPSQAHTPPPPPPMPVESDQEVCALVERYLHFAALVNEVPSWVMHPDRDKNPLIDVMVIEDEDEDGHRHHIQAYHATCFWAQRSNILTIFHCMRLLILQACIDHSLPVVVGLGGAASPLAWASRKLEIVRDFLHDLQATPFVCLEAQGETTVDKVRRVGAILLELLHKSDNATIKAQADTLFKSLLDILSRLDSKASEGLEVWGGWRGVSTLP